MIYLLTLNRVLLHCRADKGYSQSVQSCGSHDISTLLKQVEHSKTKSNSTGKDKINLFEKFK